MRNHRKMTKPKDRKPMKKILDIFAIVAVLGMAAYFTGCGDSGTDDSGTGTFQATETGTRVNAPSSLAGQSYNFTATDGRTGTINFTSGSTFSITTSGSTESGSFLTSREDDTYTLRVVTSDGRAGTLQLKFDSQTAGFFSFTVPSEPPISGSFFAASAVVGRPEAP